MPQTVWELTKEALREILDYNPKTGVFTRKRPVQRWGKKIGFLDSRNRYLFIGIKGKYYAASRLAWFYVHGKWPANQLDHINCNKLDNRICNLREASNSENSCNKKSSGRNTSGYKGVHWHKRRQKWQAAIGINNRHIYLGYFDDPIEAYKARNKAAEKIHGEFMQE